MFKLFLFDLDGTLTHSAPGIINSVKYALSKAGITESNDKVLNAFIGPPLVESFAKFYNMNEQECNAALSNYRDYFTKKGMYENHPYKDIEKTLEFLKDNGKTLAVATSKPQCFAQKIIEHFSLDKYFSGIFGPTLEEHTVGKAEIIQRAIDYFKADKSECVMIGDRRQDVLGAKACNVKCVGVLYGYGSALELESAGADYIIKDHSELKNI